MLTHRFKNARFSERFALLMFRQWYHNSLILVISGGISGGTF